jgi:pheromone shutdown protein TraB
MDPPTPLVEDDIVISGIDRSQLPEHVALRTHAGGVVLLIGTAHISMQSANDVATLIRATKPQQVLVELCPARVAIIDPENINALYRQHQEQQEALLAASLAEKSDPLPVNADSVAESTDHGVTQRGGSSEIANSNPASSASSSAVSPASAANSQPPAPSTSEKKDEKEAGKLQMLGKALSKQGGILAVAISYMYDSISSQVKLHVGDDMRTGAEEAAKIGAKIVLGDRPIGITIARAWGGLSSWQKLKLGYELLKVSFASIKAEDLEQLKNKDILTELIRELSTHYPTLCTHLLHERDLYLAHKLRSLPGPLAVGVVGLGHVEGIKKHWNDQIDIPSIMTQPPSSSWKWFFFKLFLFFGSFTGLFIAALYYIFRG